MEKILTKDKKKIYNLHMISQPLPFFRRIWFLDCFGHVLSFIPSQDRLIRTPLQSVLTNGFVPSPYPLPAKADLTWWNLWGEQLPVQPLFMKRLRRGLVTLQAKHSNEYLSINPRTDDLGFVSHANDWEKFLPVTEDALRGLAMLSDPDMTRLTSPDSERIQHLQFLSPSENKPGGAKIGEITINIYENIAVLEDLASLEAGKKKTILLSDYNDKAQHEVVVHCCSDTP